MVNCPECGDECQFGSKNNNGLDLMSLKMLGKKVLVGLHWDNEHGGACNHFEVDKEALLKALLR
jgi:hypothetical protein